ncbi:MAG: undecaprenyl-phosphate glucose phosphotransferase [Bacteroidetes bacterium]|nr:MAG: undecaprenyl-phosphate glucose phosphotransferase [Bacteroidota bacterium]
MPSLLFDFLAGKKFSRYLKVIFLGSDVILLNVSFLLSFFLRYGNLDRIWHQQISSIWLLCNVVWMLLAGYLDIYKLVRVQRIEHFLRKTIRAYFIHLAIVAIVILVLKYGEVSRLRMGYFYGLFLTFLFLTRLVSLKLLKFIRASGYNFRRVIIVGENENGRKMAEILHSDLSFGFQVMGFFCDLSHDKNIDYPVLGNISSIELFLKETDIHEMYVALHYDQSDKINELIRLAEKYHVRIKFVPDFQAYTKTRRVTIDFYGNLPVLMLRKEPLESGYHRLSKKLFDVLFSLLVILLIFSWLFPVLFILIKLSSKGPVFFKQKRTGEDNIEFTCYKFRTMRVNTLADELQATKNDPRITKLGAFMRKTNLDELPQFFNVLWGSMSVVGPRPHMIKHTEEYSELINEYLVRHFAKPGITGWAQVNGFRGETKKLEDMKKRVEFDIWYIENWSFILDLKIVWLTVWNMVRGEEKAY